MSPAVMQRMQRAANPMPPRMTWCRSPTLLRQLQQFPHLPLLPAEAPTPSVARHSRAIWPRFRRSCARRAGGDRRDRRAGGRLGVAIDAAKALRDGTTPEALRRLVLERASAAADARDVVAAAPSLVLPQTKESPISCSREARGGPTESASDAARGTRPRPPPNTSGPIDRPPHLSGGGFLLHP